MWILKQSKGDIINWEAGRGLLPTGGRSVHDGEGDSDQADIEALYLHGCHGSPYGEG